MARSSEPEGYVLRGGRAGAQRLRLLNRVKWPTTETLLVAAGGPIFRVLLLGDGTCAGLEVALEARGRASTREAREEAG